MTISLPDTLPLGYWYKTILKPETSPLIISSRYRPAYPIFALH